MAEDRMEYTEQAEQTKKAGRRNARRNAEGPGQKRTDGSAPED